MYVKRIQLHNYGPITRLDLTFPFDEDKPKPVVLVGENGSGKSVLLSHIVNGLLLAKQVVYPETPEVDKGKVYKIRSSSYIQSGEEYSFSKIDFEGDLHVSELNLRETKQTYQHTPESIVGTDAQELWDRIGHDERDEMTHTFRRDKKNVIEEIFSTRCVLYFPPNRFEEPAWLNERNLKARAQYMGHNPFIGHTERRIINYSPLRDNENWLFDLAYDYSVFELQTHLENIPYRQPDDSDVIRTRTIFDGFSGKSTNLFNIANQIVRIIMPKVKDARLRIGKRSQRVVSIEGIDKRHVPKIFVPNIFQLSSGEVSLLNLFLSILRDYDLSETSVDRPEDICGIVVVDEIDLHLHVKHQYEILSKLMEVFPRIQFVITTHSPLFPFGLQKTFGEDGFVIRHLPKGEQVNPEEFREFDEAYRVFSDTRRHSDAVSDAIRNSQKPLIFVEGKTDVEYLERAAELLGMQQILEKVQLQDGGGTGRLHNTWKRLTGMKVHLNHQRVILLHDCDNEVLSDERENVFRWTIPLIKSHPIQKGIENRFSKVTLEEVMKIKPEFIDIAWERKITLGGEDKTIPTQWSVNKDEKTKLCNWLCEKGEAVDFEHFREIFDKLSKILDR